MTEIIAYSIPSFPNQDGLIVIYYITKDLKLNKLVYKYDPNFIPP